MAGIDLSVLYSSSSSSSSSGTQSAVAVYKRLQKTAEENEAETDGTSSSSALDEQIRQMQNTAIAARNKIYASDNQQVQSDAAYMKSLASSGASAEDLLNDDRFLRISAEANGMGDLYRVNKERLKAILSSDLNDPNSVARQGSTHELELAKKYNLGAAGNDGISSSLAASEASAYSTAKTKALLEEIPEPSTSEADEPYEYDSDEYQIFIKRSDVQKDITYFKENIGDVESLDDLFSNSRLLTFVLSAYDLESEAANKGKLRKILESDLSDEDSLANRFSDTRFLKLAQDLNVAEDGVSTLTSDSMVSGLVEKYQRIEYEKHLDEQAPGVRAAIEFSRRLPDATSTVSLLGDSVLREVVTVANAIPKEIAYQETEAQVTAVERKVDLAELQSDPDAVEKLVSRYLVLKDSSSSSSGSNSYLLDLFS